MRMRENHFSSWVPTMSDQMLLSKACWHLTRCWQGIYISQPWRLTNDAAGMQLNCTHVSTMYRLCRYIRIETFNKIRLIVTMQACLNDYLSRLYPCLCSNQTNYIVPNIIRHIIKVAVEHMYIRSKCPLNKFPWNRDQQSDEGIEK